MPRWNLPDLGPPSSCTRRTIRPAEASRGIDCQLCGTTQIHNPASTLHAHIGRPSSQAKSESSVAVHVSTDADRAFGDRVVSPPACPGRKCRYWARRATSRNTECLFCALDPFRLARGGTIISGANKSAFTSRSCSNSALKTTPRADEQLALCDDQEFFLPVDFSPPAEFRMSTDRGLRPRRSSLGFGSVCPQWRRCSYESRIHFPTVVHSIGYPRRAPKHLNVKAWALHPPTGRIAGRSA